MEQKKIDRINELARKSRAEGLSAAEAEEQRVLRAEYIAAFRASLVSQLDSTVIIDQNGVKRPLRRKD